MGRIKESIIGLLIVVPGSILAVSPAQHLPEPSQRSYVTTEAALRAEVFFNLKSMKQMIRSTGVGEWRLNNDKNSETELSQRKK